MSAAKQRFYENHSGSSITEINRITASILVGHVLYSSLTRCGFVKSRIDQYSWAFVCYFFNVLLATTVYSNRHGQLLLLYSAATAPLLVLEFFSVPLRKAQIKQDESHRSRGGDGTRSAKKQRVTYLSVYRATMMITTVISILAVDLPIFPRRYAKSETWGTSLMDLGVGSFVFSSGIVSSRLQAGVFGSLRQGGIILGMGVARALMVRGTGYHEHVSEYGTHWNFFITLSLLPPLVPAFRKLQRRVPYFVQGAIICLAYQVLLLKTNWQSWIIGAYRDNLISANKEGLSSFVGYVSIFLFGLDAGNFILSKRQRPVLILLFCNAVAFATAYLFVTEFLNIRVSRRIANAPYILWTAAHNVSFILTLALIEKAFIMLAQRQRGDSNSQAKSLVPALLEKLNSQGLWVFLGSNLLTGAINLIFGDAMMFTNVPRSLAILLAYSISISGVAFSV